MKRKYGMNRKRYTSNWISLDKTIDEFEKERLQVLCNYVRDAAYKLSTGWNIANYTFYENSIQEFMCYLVSLENKYDMIIVLTSHKITNMRAARSCYFYSISHAKR